MFAALASLVSRQEDVGTVTSPATMLLLAPYFLAVTVQPGEQPSTAVELLSMVPLLSPMLMPMRIAVGVDTVSVIVSFAISVVALGALIWAAGRIYGESVLRTGARVPVKDALRSIVRA